MEHIAALAHLELSPEARERMARELSKVLAFVETLRALAPADPELASFAQAGAPLRDDRVNGRRLDPGTATAMAPEAEDGFFLVPPIVENLEP